MKRSASLFFILLANIIILVHSTIPHHHEGAKETKCRIMAHKHLDSNSKCPHNDTYKFQNNNSDTTGSNGITFEECQLEDIYIRPTDNDNSIGGNNSALESIMYYIPHFILRLILPEPLQEIHTYATYVCPTYDSIVSQLQLLRAPPKY